MGYSLHEMCLSQACLSVDEKWVVDLSRSLCYCLGSCGS